MDYPKTKDEWWKSVQDNLQDLRTMVVRFFPSIGVSHPEFPITAGAAEGACESARAQIIKEQGKEFDPAATFDYAVREKDHDVLLKLLDGAWFGMPESQFVQSIAGFNVLCDLCSECHVLFPEDWEGEE